MLEMDSGQAAELYDEMDRVLVGAILESKKAGGTRIDQLIDLAHRMGILNIGIAYCVGFAEQAEKLAERFAKDFEVTAVDCKVHGLQAEDLVPGASGTLCNPAGQADVLNMAGTDLNISVGLCLGHDMIFQKHSIAPVTVLTVKDRATDHNPLSALE